MFTRSSLTVFEVLTMMLAASAHARGFWWDAAVFFAAGTASIIIREARKQKEPTK